MYRFTDSSVIIVKLMLTVSYLINIGIIVTFYHRSSLIEPHLHVHEFKVQFPHGFTKREFIRIKIKKWIHFILSGKYYWEVKKKLSAVYCVGYEHCSIFIRKFIG